MVGWLLMLVCISIFFINPWTFAEETIEVDSILSRKVYANVAPGAIAEDVSSKPFDMEYVRNAPSLEPRVIHDWHKVDGPVPTYQKHIEITVCEWWPGYKWRVPVHLTVPEGGAHGFIITGRSGFDEEDQKGSGKLLAGGIGEVATKIKALGAYPGGRKAEQTSTMLFIKTKDYRYTRLWLWSMTIMRAATAALAEEEYFKPGKIAGFGGSKNGMAPTTALIHDDRFTGVRPSVAPPHECPYTLGDPEAVREVEEASRRFFEALDTGEMDLPMGRDWYVKNSYGRKIFRILTESTTELQEIMLANGWTENDIRRVLREIYQMCMISLNFDKLEKRGCEVLFDIGSHDNVTPDLAYLGAKYPQIPVCIYPNGGHGQQGKSLLPFSAGGDNYTAFMSNHFFGDRPMMIPPKLSYERKGSKIEIRVEFQSGPPADTGTIYWMFDREPGGSAGYVAFYFKLQKDMERVDERTWKTEIECSEDASTVEFFTFHSNTINDMRAHISSPYTQIKLK